MQEMIKNVKKKGRVRHLPDSHLQKSPKRRESGEKIKYKIGLSVNAVAFIGCRCRLCLQLMKATVLAESSILYFIFSPDSLYYSDVYRFEQVGVAHFPSFQHFLSFHLSRFSFYTKIYEKYVELSIPLNFSFCISYKFLPHPL